MNNNVSKNATYKELNPYLEEAIRSQRNVNKRIGVGSESKMVVDESTGDMERVQAIYYKNSSYDPRKFVKVYIHNFEKIIELSKSGQTVLTYIIDECIEKDKDHIYLIPKLCQQYLANKGKKLTLTTIYNGINSLEEQDFMSKSKFLNSKYFLNINILHNGKMQSILNNVRKLHETNNEKIQSK